MNDWNFQKIANLNEILANLYPREGDARRLVATAGLKVTEIDFEGSSLARWFAILQFANARTVKVDGITRSKVDEIVARALEENPDDESLKGAAMRQPPESVKGPEAKEWQGPAAADRLEKIMGDKSTLVPLSYFEVGLARARSVVRIIRENGTLGTGFITTGNKLITNNHVLPDAEAARSSIIQFNYQQTVDGLSAPVKEAKLLPDTFRTSVEDDWSAVTIDGEMNSVWGMIKLKPVDVKVGDHVNIIQHPGGGPKQVSLFANVVVFVGGGRIQYLTDTLPGSSGSPVFDAQWNLIALHHSGGWLTEPNASSKSTYFRNEGIAIGRLLEGLAQMA